MCDLISVVIPAYNVKPYIQKCVRSVLNQTYTNLEVILVDDGSTDGTARLCDALQNEDKRIVVIHQENKGLSAARNAGIEVAKGDWIAFLDSDDWIEPEMYQCLHTLAVENAADIASCRTRDCHLDCEPPNVIDTCEVMILDSESMIKGLVDQHVVRFEVWNKLWRRTLIGDVRFKTGQVSEDVYFDRVLFLKANRMVHIEKTLHNYLIQRPGNTLSSFKAARLCVFNEFEALMEDVKELDMGDAADAVACIATSFSVSMYREALKTRQGKEMLRELDDTFNKFYRTSKRSSYRTNRGRVGMRLFSISPRIYCCIWNWLYE